MAEIVGRAAGGTVAGGAVGGTAVFVGTAVSVGRGVLVGMGIGVSVGGRGVDVDTAVLVDGGGSGVLVGGTTSGVHVGGIWAMASAEAVAGGTAASTARVGTDPPDWQAANNMIKINNTRAIRRLVD